MFANATKKEYQFLDNGALIGHVRVNENFSFSGKFKRPMERNQRREITMVGHVNYALLDQFIISALNDYYQKISQTGNMEEYNQRVLQYNELYQLWYKVNVAKQNHDIGLNSYYDDIVYKLYLLGYHDV